MAVGGSLNDLSNIGYSSDGGETWLVSTNTGGLFKVDEQGRGIAYGNGRFVTVGGSDNDVSGIGFSTNGGVTWTVVSPADQNGLFRGSYGRAIAYANGRFVAVGGSTDDLSNIGYSSDGGENWTVAANPDGLFRDDGDGRGFGIAYGDGRFVAVGDSTDDLSNIGYSSDGGENWTVSANPDGLFRGDRGQAIAYGNGRFVAVGNSTDDLSNIGYSSDGQTWTVVSNPNGLFQGEDGYGIAYGNGLFVAVGDSTDDLSNIGYSSDGGQTWIVSANPDGLFQGGDGRAIAYGNGRFVAVGDSTDDLSNIGYSSDGQTWTVVSNPNGLFQGDSSWRGIAFSTPPSISNICFPAGTPIKTDQGIFPIEKLHANKHTINKQPIRHITKTVTQDTHLICFEKNALGPNVPSEKTIMTKEHKILFEGQYKSASYFLTRSNKVKKVKYNGELLYNVLLATYGTLQVNNLVCETLHPDNLIAKLYNNYKEAERPDLVCQLNASLLERDARKYKAVERKILHK